MFKQEQKLRAGLRVRFVYCEDCPPDQGERIGIIVACDISPLWKTWYEIELEDGSDRPFVHESLVLEVLS